MSQLQASTDTKKPNLIVRMLNRVEGVANRLPHPFILFIWLAIAVMILSWLLGTVLGVTFLDPSTGKQAHIQNLLSARGLDYMLTHMLSNFTSFPPLGYVLAVVLAVGVCERVGLLEASIKKLIEHTPASLITYSVIGLGIMGNIASDVSLVFIPPLAAMVFMKAGRHPVAGLIAGYCSVSAGYAANLLIANLDVLLAGISTKVAQTVDPNAYVSPLSNWYFSIASLIVLTVVGVFVTEKIIEPKLGTYKGNLEGETDKPISKVESKALRNTGIAVLLYFALLVVTLLIPNSPLTNKNGGILPTSPFLHGIVPIITFLFLVAGITYGISIKKIKNSKDIPEFMGEGIKEMSGFIVLVFAAAQFINYFQWTNLASWVAVAGSNLLKSIHFTGIGVIFGFLLLNCIMGLFIVSGSALWAITGTIFIPLFMQLNYDPAYIQAAYRIASSITIPIAPVSPFLLIVLGFLKKYDNKAGVGTVITLSLPYAIGFLILWTILFLIFSLFNIPFGPGVGVHLH